MSIQVLRIETRDALDPAPLRHCAGEYRPPHARQAGEPERSNVVYRDNREAARARIAELTAKPRRGRPAKHAVDMVFAGPPRYADESRWDGERIKAWAEDTIRWVERAFPTATIAIAALHQDEAAPHVHLTLVPEIDGRLSWRECVQRAVGARDYQKAQDAYHHAVAERHGLDRGERLDRARQKKPTREHRPLSLEAGRRLAAKEHERAVALAKWDAENEIERAWQRADAEKKKWNKELSALRASVWELERRTMKLQSWLKKNPRCGSPRPRSCWRNTATTDQGIGGRPRPPARSGR